MSDKDFESELLNDLFEDAKVPEKNVPEYKPPESNDSEILDFLDEEPIQPQVKSNPQRQQNNGGQVSSQQTQGGTPQNNNIQRQRPTGQNSQLKLQNGNTRQQQGQGMTMHGNRPTQQQGAQRRPTPNGSLGNTVKPTRPKSNSSVNPYAGENSKRQGQQGENPPVKKEKKKLTKWQKQLILIVVIVVAVIGVSATGYKIYDSVREKPLPEVDYEQTGRRAVDEYISLVKKFDYEKMNKQGEEEFSDGISYIGMEQEYANSGEAQLQFLSKVFGVVDVKYPEIAIQSNKGGDYVDKAGNKSMVESPLTDGEPVKVTIVDWNALATSITGNAVSIADSFRANGYSKDDLDITNKLSTMFCQYINSLSELPTTEVEWTPEVEDIGQEVGEGKEKKTVPFYILKSDGLLDNIILGSDAYHACLDAFGKAATSWTPTVKQSYIGTNPKYTKWKKQYKKITRYCKKKKKSYPGGKKLIKYNKKMQLQKYKKGKKKGEYIYIKKPKKKATLTRDVDNPYVPEVYLPYTYLGSYFAQNGYNNGQTKVMPLLGNGTFQQPAGVGTPVLTKVRATDGKFYDCRVTLTMYVAGQSAINYAARYSEKNRGFLSNNTVQLSCFEVNVENLSGKTITFNEDLALCDERNDMSPRTGLMYGFKMKGKAKAGETITLQSYLVDTDLANKYLVWGKSFERRYEPVWFRVLKNNVDELKPMLEENNSDIVSEKTSDSEATPTPNTQQ